MAEQMLATMQQMLAAMQANQEDLLQRVQAAEVRAVTAEQRAVGAESRFRTRVIDSRELDRVERFDGSRKAWPDWSFSFKGILEETTLKAMRWTCQQEDAIDAQSIDVEDTTWHAHNTALFKALVTKANAGEAATKIRAAGEGMGLEVWRTLVEYYEPRSRGRQREVFNKKVTKPTFDKSKSLLNNIESWEQDVRDYEKRFDKVVDADLRISVLLELAPEAVREHVYINSEKYATYESIREKLVSYIESKMIEDTVATTPMEIGQLGGQSKRFEGYCDNCGKYGHKRKDCWQTEDKGGYQDNKGKGKGKDSKDSKCKGKGTKSKGKGSDKRKGKGKGKDFKGIGRKGIHELDTSGVAQELEFSANEWAAWEAEQETLPEQAAGSERNAKFIRFGRRRRQG